MVFDRFHVIKLYNDGLSDLRRKLYHEATDLMQEAGPQRHPLAAAEEPGKPGPGPQRSGAPKKPCASISLWPWPIT